MTQTYHEASQLEVMLIGESGSPGFRGGDIARIRRSVEGIRGVLTDSGRLMVLSLGSPRSNHAASILIENSWIADHSVGNDFVSAPTPLKDMMEDERATAKDFAALVKPYALKAADDTEADKPTGLVLVAGADLVSGLSRREGIYYAEAIDLGPLAMNHFSIDFPSA